MTDSGPIRFQAFFKEGGYLFLKNELYNYRLRKKAVNRCLKNEILTSVLEVGSGISPMITGSRAVVYSDLSFSALEILRKKRREGAYVVADGMNLPFKTGAFSHTICSEVLEHMADDRRALKELQRVMKPAAMLVITLPHRKSYFSHDDRFVSHYRRYEVSETKERLNAAGFKLTGIRKVLGPLDKLTMSLAVYAYTLIRRLTLPAGPKEHDTRLMQIAAYGFRSINRMLMGLAWLDARIMPLSLSAVILATAVKKDRPSPERAPAVFSR